MTHEPFIRLPDEGRVLDMGPFRMRVRAETHDTGGGFTLLEADEPPGFGPPLHVHDDAAEAFYVLEGEYVVFLGDDERLCPAGSFIFVPVGVEHGFRVGRVHSRKLNLYLPAAMIGYFEELAAAQAAGDPLTDDELRSAAARHAMRVLGPVPEGYV
jgi:mannose-6-phosphate isomerase-like protein (cupin superfamily)